VNTVVLFLLFIIIIIIILLASTIASTTTIPDGTMNGARSTTPTRDHGTNAGPSAAGDHHPQQTGGALSRTASSISKKNRATPTTKVLTMRDDAASPFMLDYGEGSAVAPGEQPECEAHQQQAKSKIKHQQDLAFTIVWSPLPPITWLIPFIGHTGICDSNGVASDFRGPYYVGDDGRMAFGAPTRALTMLSPASHTQRHGADGSTSATTGVAAQWDAAIAEANTEYRGRTHNICCDNCHSHVAFALNRMQDLTTGMNDDDDGMLLRHKNTKWDMIKICFLVFFRARFLSWGGFLKQFLPFGILVALVVFLRAR